MHAQLFKDFTFMDLVHTITPPYIRVSSQHLDPDLLVNIRLGILNGLWIALGVQPVYSFGIAICPSIGTIISKVVITFIKP